MIELTDDGTLDTVLVCSKCRQEFRFNYDPYDWVSDDLLEVQQQSYDDWVDEIISETTLEHECNI